MTPIVMVIPVLSFDVRQCAARLGLGGTLMRHFICATLAKAPLACRMMVRTARTGLIAPCGSP
jgi:hypothetical protein